MDLSGRMVIQTQVTKNDFQISVAKLKAGIYQFAIDGEPG